MIRHPLLFEVNGKYEPSYVFDLGGRLVVRDASGSSISLIPFAVKTISFKSNGGYVYDTYDVELIKAEIVRYSMGKLWGSKLMRSAYPFGDINRSKHVYVPHKPKAKFISENANDLMDQYERSMDQVEKALVIEPKLNEMGIFKIPHLEKFNPSYHQVKNDSIAGQLIKTIFEGWMTDNVIIRKALVEPI